MLVNFLCLIPTIVDRSMRVLPMPSVLVVAVQLLELVDADVTLEGNDTSQEIEQQQHRDNGHCLVK